MWNFGLFGSRVCRELVPRRKELSPRVTKLSKEVWSICRLFFFLFSSYSLKKFFFLVFLWFLLHRPPPSLLSCILLAHSHTSRYIETPMKMPTDCLPPPPTSLRHDWHRDDTWCIFRMSCITQAQSSGCWRPRNTIIPGSLVLMWVSDVR